MVGELILERDRVGLPGVGTFVAEVVPATFSDKGYTINPPYRRLSFTSEVLEEDCLADFYAGENAIDRVSAKAFLTAFLSEMKDVLKERKAVTFPGLGRLRATRQNTFFFVPSEELDIYPDGFGLESVSLKTHIETDEDISIAVSDLASVIETARAAAPAADPEPSAKLTEENAAIEEVPAVTEVAEVAESEPEAVEERETVAEQAPRKSRRWVWPLVIAILAVLLFAAFLVLARVAPDFIDKILYTEEELRIINA